MSYELIPGRRRALCCECGTMRTCSVNWKVPNSTPEACSPEYLAELQSRGVWLHIRPWERVLGDMECASCGKITQHALLRDHDHERGRNLAEDVNYGRDVMSPSQARERLLARLDPADLRQLEVNELEVIC